MKHLLKLMTLAALLSLQACALSSRPINGHVLDEETGKPVADAIVVITWQGNWYKIVEGSTFCYHVETARTDAEGEYHIPAWSLPWQMEHMTVSSRVVNAEAFKPGYTRPAKWNSTQERILLRRFKGTKEEYFNYLERVMSGASCTSAGESKKNLYRLYLAVEEEEKSVAETAEQKKAAEWSAYLAECWRLCKCA